MSEIYPWIDIVDEDIDDEEEFDEDEEIEESSEDSDVTQEE